jgi:hypothetical protein
VTPTTTLSSPKSSKAHTAATVPTWDKIVANVAQHYLDTTPQRTKLLDGFMAFLVVVGGLQFLYCILAGNYVRFPPNPPIYPFSERKMVELTYGRPALQCLLVRVLCDGGAICLDRCV